MKKYLFIIFILLCSFGFMLNVNAKTCKIKVVDCSSLSSSECSSNKQSCTWNQGCHNNGSSLSTIGCTNKGGKIVSGYCEVTADTCESGWQQVSTSTSSATSSNNTSSGNNSSGSSSSSTNLEYSLCEDANVLRALRVFGYIINVAKILVPIIIVITGIVSLFKAMVNDDPKTKDEVSKLITKIIIGVFIAFLPTIIDLIMTMVSEYSESFKNGFAKCSTCLTDVSSCTECINSTQCSVNEQ